MIFFTGNPKVIRFLGSTLFEELIHAAQYFKAGSPAAFSQIPTSNKEFEAKFILDYIAQKNVLSGLEMENVFAKSNTSTNPFPNADRRSFAIFLGGFIKTRKNNPNVPLDFNTFKTDYFKFANSFREFNKNTPYGQTPISETIPPQVLLELLKLYL